MPQGRNKEIYEIPIFDGGINDRVDPQYAAPNQALVIQNLAFDDYGSLTLYNKFKTLNSTTIGSSTRPLDGLYSYKPSTMSALLLSVCNGLVYVNTGTASAPVEIGSAASLFTALVPVEILAFQELAFFTNGNQQPYKFNGTEFTRAGISAPSQVLTAACDAAGLPNGTYRYVYWGVNSYAAEGDYIATPSTAVAIVSGAIRVNNIPTAPASHGINTWKMGRNTAGATGVYWYLTDITNGTTSFTDNIADASLVTEAPTDQGYLRKFNFWVAYGNRLWGAVEDYLWYSNLNQPEEFPSENFVRVGRGDGMNISAIIAFKGMIVISKSDYNGKTALYQLLIGDSVSFSDPENWVLKLVANEGGSDSHRACVVYEDSVFLYNRNGAFSFNGSGLSLVGGDTTRGTAVSNKISNLVKLGENATVKAQSRYACATNFANKVWLAFGTGNDATAQPNNKLYIFDYTRLSNRSRVEGGWSNLLTATPLQFAIHEGALYGATNASGAGSSSYRGYIHQLDNPSSNGVTVGIGLSYYSPMINGNEGHEDYHKDFRFIHVTMKGSGTVKIYAAVDLQNPVSQLSASDVLETVTLTSNGSVHVIKLPATMHGKWVTVAASQTAADTPTSFTLSKIRVIYTLRGLRNG